MNFHSILKKEKGKREEYLIYVKGSIVDYKQLKRPYRYAYYPSAFSKRTLGNQW